MSDIQRTIRINKSRKQHICEHCNLIIPTGSSYNRTSGLFDGESFDIKAHIECDEFYIELNKDEGPYDWWPICDDPEYPKHVARIKTLYKLEI
jgi:hypothetical protein